MSSPTQIIDDLLLSECEATPEVPEDFANVLRAFFPRAAHLVNTLVFPDQSLANINIGSHIIAVTQEGHAEWRSRSPDTTTQRLASRENLNPASLNWVASKILAIANKTFRDAVHPDNLLPDLQAALDMCTPRMVVEEALEHQPDLPWRPHKNRPNTYFVTLYYSPFRAELITCGHLFIAWKENRWLYGGTVELKDSPPLEFKATNKAPALPDLVKPQATHLYYTRMYEWLINAGPSVP